MRLLYKLQVNSDAKNVVFYSIFRPGDFECLSIREELISLWRKRGSDLGGGPEGATRSLEQRAGRRSGAEVGSGGRERRSGAGSVISDAVSADYSRFAWI